MPDPWQVDVDCQRPGGAHLKNGDRETEKRKEGQTKPVTKRAAREPFDGVSLGLAGEFVAVQRYDEEVLDVFADDFAVVAPEGRDGIKEKREGVKTNVPKLLISVSNVFFQRGDLRKLKGHSAIAT